MEGPTDDPVIKELRARQQRNLLATLLLSHGTPMILAGDEFSHTQNGNNNAYAQDNEDRQPRKTRGIGAILNPVDCPVAPEIVRCPTSS